MTMKLSNLPLTPTAPKPLTQPIVSTLGGVPVSEGETWQNLSKEQRAQYFRNLETKSKSGNTHANGNSENYSRG